MKSNQYNKFGLPTDEPLKWYQTEPNVETSNDVSDLDQNLLYKYSKVAENLLAEEVLKYNNKQHGNNRYQHNWMKTIMSKGTLADKVAAQIVQVQNSPIHSLALINNLTSMVKVGKKKECLQVMENLVELWLNDLLVPDRKLVPFSARPLHILEQLDQALQHKCLLHWWFEGRLKEFYIAFIKALEVISKDSIESIKGKAIGCMSKLLAANAEQEQLLLAQLVNKLGDPHQEVASKAIHYLQLVLRKHPNMQPVVLEEVEKMIFRPNIQPKAQYYSVCFLIQFHLSLEDKNLASSMINLYFCLFKACIKKGELDSKMMQNLLSGVKRAFPYAKDSFSDTLADHVDTLHKLVHVSSFGVALHALCLLHQVAQASSSIEDRFYSALYKKMLDPEALKTKHLALFLNIVYKSLKNDSKPARVQAYVKRLLQLALSAHSNLACSILYLVSQVICRNRDQIILELKAEESGTVKFEEDDDEEEKYTDVKLNEDEETVKPEMTKPSGSWSWVEDKQGRRPQNSDPNEYEPFSRNPLFSKAEKVGLRELALLASHYHPTVALFAQNLLDKEIIKYSGDILVDFSSARFLDRFSFKNPKKEAQKGPVFSRTSQYQPKGVRSLRIDSTRFLNISEEQIPKEDLFMYQYMQKKMQAMAEKKEEEEKDESDNESVNSEEFEKMLFGNRKDLDDDDDDDEVEEDEEIDEGSLDFEHDVVKAEKSGKGKKTKKRQVLHEDDDDEDGDFSDEEGLPSDFASAEEFAEMLQNAGIDDNAAGSHAVRNADNSHAKQLKWEQNRERGPWGGGGNKRKAKGPMIMGKGKKRKTK
ncbi:CCAAT/enhancer-binding protein zeta [Cloeon dipterum]|uniref:CCAAT/enhancer-binding protein zeta n=1 Tax=Cloeon dipterum TaxID=197152 RepID=UPI00321F782C